MRATTAIQRRFVITAETQSNDFGTAVRVITYSTGDPGGYPRWLNADNLDAEISHMAAQGYQIEDRREPDPPSSDTPDPTDPSDGTTGTTACPPDRGDIHRRMQAARDALGGSYALAGNMDLPIELVRGALADIRGTGDGPLAQLDAKLTELGFPPSQAPSAPVREYPTPYTNPADGLPLVISQGIGGDGPWMVFRRHDTSLKRISTPALPERATPEECRRDLDEWMAKKGWRSPEPSVEPEAPRSEVEQAPDVPAPEIRRIPVEEIITDGGTQVRVETDEEAIRTWALRMRDGIAFEAIDVFLDDDGNYWLANGFHRHAAATLAELPDIKARVHLGSRLDALLFSAHADTAGECDRVRRTNADKRNAAVRMLEEPSFADWSLNKIAGHCDVSTTHVHNLAADMGDHRSKRATRPEVSTQSGNVPTSAPAGGGNVPTSAAPPTPSPAPAPAPRTAGEQAPAASYGSHPSSTSYPSERTSPPAPSGPRLPEPPSDDDRTPTITVKRFAEACYDTILTVHQTSRGEGEDKRRQAIIAVIAQHIQDAIAAAKEGRIG